MSGREVVEDAGLIKNGLFRIALAGGVGGVMFEAFDAASFAFLGIFLSLAFGILMILGRPTFLVEDALVRVVVDTLAVTLVVAGVGGTFSPFALLYFIAAIGIALIGAPIRAGIGAGAVMAGYFVAVVVSAGAGTLLGSGGALRTVLLAVFCGAAWVFAEEVRALKEENSEVSGALSAEIEYSGSVSALMTSFGSVLEVLDLRRILGWTAEAARDLTGASYAHVVLLDGNQHRTSARGESEVYPTWWHPVVQELVLHGCRSDGPLRDEDKEADGISGFLAMPVEAAGSEHNGTLLIGGGEFGEREERILALLADQASFALRGAGESPGGRDPVTGLPNRSSLHRVLDRELSYDGSMTVVSVRIDGLWEISRSQGVVVGEALLRRIAERIAERQRVFRYGMDELFVLIRGGSERRARRTVGWVRDVTREVSDGSGLSPEVTIGYAMAHSDDPKSRSLIPTARRAAREAEPELRDSISGVPEAANGIVAALLEAATLKDFELNAHMRSVRRLSRLIGMKMGLESEEIKVLSLGALLHDVGKIGVPDSILKKPGALTDAEYDVIKRHTLMGASVISQVPELAGAVPVIRHHHERFDGAGYPDGLPGADIPLAARIVFVADAYDSMTRDRSYRKGLTHEVALEEIANNSGTQFDPEVAQTFLKIMREAERMSG
ncbi:MAG: HD domain-containing phosphohydrolase [Rubrobacteraceae bacterium]